MGQLSLDDSRWSQLEYREGRGTWIAHRLGRLVANPGDLRDFNDLWPYLCSEGTAWSASYAAAPYVVEIATALPPAQRLDHLYFLGLVEMCSEPGGCPHDLRDAYRQALADAHSLLAQTLVCAHDLADTRYLLAAAAALKGHLSLANLLDSADCPCPHCGESLLE